MIQVKNSSRIQTNPAADLKIRWFGECSEKCGALMLHNSHSNNSHFPLFSNQTLPYFVVSLLNNVTIL